MVTEWTDVVHFGSCRISKVGSKDIAEDPESVVEQSVAQVASSDHYKKMYDRISGLANIGVWEFDLVTEELIWTDTVYDLFEIPRGTVLQRSDTLKHYDPRSLREMEQLRSEAILRGSGFAMDILIRTAKGADRCIRLTADIEQKDGKSVRIFGTKQDVTAERAAQQKVQFLQNQLGHLARASAMEVMASTLAHKVSQPLAAATNYLSASLAIAAREPVSPKIHHGLQEGLQSTMRAGEIIRQMRDMTRKVNQSSETFELEHVVKEALSLITSKHPNLTIKCDLGPPAAISGDFFQLQQVFINLISNACEATAGGACHVTIHNVKGNSKFEITVSDNGPGIEQDILPDIFEAFVTTKPNALGIGLSIAQTIIEAHGGNIRAFNLPAGGVSFSFNIPFAAPETPAPG
ncbi:MAG: HAMP domain-containing sensor histidine kinase [Pseudomonadota bacterium]